MPKIPTSGKQVRGGVFRAPQISSRAPIVGTRDTGRQLGAIAQKAIEVAQNEAERSNQFEVEEYTTKIRDAYRKSLWGDMETGSSGFLQNKGKNAMLAYADSQKEFYDNVDNIIAESGSEEVKARLMVQANKFKSDYDYQINNHTSRERESHYINQTLVNISSIQETAKAGYVSFLGDRSVVDDNIRDLNTLVYGATDNKGNEITKGYADRMGMSKAEADDYYLNQVSALHYGVVTQSLNNGQDRLGREYYKQAIAKGEIDGDTRAKLDKVVLESGLRGDSLRLVNEALGKSENKAQAQMYIRDKLKESDPELLDASLTRLDRRWTEEAQARFEIHRLQMRDINEKVRELGDDINIPPEQKAIMDEKHKKVLKKFIKSYGQHGINPPTNFQFYSDFKKLASLPDKQREVLNIKLEYRIHELSKQHYDELQGIQDKIRSGIFDSRTELGGFLKVSQAVTKVAGELGLKKKAKYAFENAVNDQVTQWEKANGREMSPEEVVKIADMLGTEVDVDRQAWDSRVFEMDFHKQVEEIDYGEIPQRHRTRIAKNLLAKGKKVTFKSIKKIYLLEMQQYRRSGNIPKNTIDSEFLLKL